MPNRCTTRGAANLGSIVVCVQKVVKEHFVDAVLVSDLHEAQPLIVKELVVLRDEERTPEDWCRVDEVSHHHEHVVFVEQELGGKLTNIIFLFVALQLQATFLVTVPWRQQDKLTKIAKKLTFDANPCFTSITSPSWMVSHFISPTL